MNAVSDSILIRSYKGEKTSRIPVWLMRQAGRYLPEYRALRAQHSMLELIRAPKLAAEVTLQPFERFDLDGAIIFPDILTPLIGMGLQLDFVKGEGPQIANPVRTLDDIKALKLPAPKDNVAYTLEAIELVCSKLAPKGIPTLGFSGAPFTLSTYMIEGGGSDHQLIAKRLMREQPEAWKALQLKLVDLVSDYLLAQIKAGASAVQIFDSWVGSLSSAEFSEFVLPYLVAIVTKVKAATDAPIIYFSTSSSGLYEQMRELPVAVIGVDWRITLQKARALLGDQVVLQGNLDPSIMCGSPEYAARRTKEVLADGVASGPFVFNLGHGIMPDASIDTVVKVISTVHEYKR